MYEEELMEEYLEEGQNEMILKLLEKLSTEAVADLLDIPLERVEAIAEQQAEEDLGGVVFNRRLRWKLVGPTELDEYSEKAFEKARNRVLKESRGIVGQIFFKEGFKEGLLEGSDRALVKIWTSGIRGGQQAVLAILLNRMTMEEISSYLRIPLAEVEALIDN